MLGYLPGLPYRRGPFPSMTGLEAVGAFLARLDRALSGFSHPASSHFMPWDICRGHVLSAQFRALIPGEARPLCEPLFQRVETNVYPSLDKLRRQVIHQDAHGNNLLREDAQSEAVVGIIDFGDMIEGPLISDVAVCASHFMETGPDPVAVAAAICRGFESVTRLEPLEKRLLLDLVTARQLLTLQLFEFRRLNMPHAPALDVEEKPRIIRSLERLAAIDPAEFANRLDAAEAVS